MTRFAVVVPDGSVGEHEDDIQSSINGSVLGQSNYTALDNPAEGVTVFFDPSSSGAYNWQATRLLRDRILQDDRICGTAYVTGPLNEQGTPSDIPEDVLTDLRERKAARG